MNPNQVENKPEQKIDQVENQPNPVQNKEEQSPPIKSEENQANWKAFREQKETERKAREAAEKRAAEKAAEAEALKAALEAALNKQTKQYSTPQYSEDIEESEEQRIDKRVKQIIEEREAIAERQRLEREQQEYPQRLSTVYPDFNKTIANENLDYLEYHHPEVTAAYRYMPDGFEKWALIYKAIKKFVPNSDSKHDSNKAERNLQKPGSISSTGTSQGVGNLPPAFLSEERKRANWERMERMRKGIS